MTGPVVMPQAPSLSSQPGAKIANPVNAAKLDTGKSGAFAALLAGLDGETDAPGGADQDSDAKRDERAGPSQVPVQMTLPLPITMPLLAPLTISPEKAAQSRFAEELSASLPPDVAQTKLTSQPPTTQAEPLVQDDTTKAIPQATPPAKSIVSAPPVQPPSGNGAEPTVSSASPGAVRHAQTAPATLSAAALATSSAPPVGASAGPQQRTVAKSTKDERANVATDPAAPAVAAAEPSAVPSATSSDPHSGQDGERDDTARTLPAAKDTKVTVIAQETHFAPGPQQSPAYQIANRIAHDAQAADPATVVQPAAQPKEAASAPLKVLQLQLDPPELGALTIRMSLRDDALHLQIEASHHDTARLIERDRDALTGLLRSAGYGVDGVNVQVTTGDRGNGAQQFSGGGGFNQSAGQNPAGRQPDNSGSGAAWQRPGTPDKTAENSRETEPPGAPLRRGGPVYL